MDHLCYLCLVFAMLSLLFIVALWADLLALVCDFFTSHWYPGTGVELDCIDS